MYPSAYIKIIRISNAAMAATAVFLGAWISATPLSLYHVSLLALAATCSTGFGNVLNDIADRATDRISHPKRPLVSGTMTLHEAWGYALLLAVIALASAFFVGQHFGVATVFPLLLLAVYARYLKGTPFTGNIVVSLLVAYALLFGGLGAPGFNRLLIPAALAFLLNFSREIIKDIEDAPGDHAVGIITTASLAHRLLRQTILLSSALYGALLFLPFILGLTGKVYVGLVIVTVLPLHLYRLKILRTTEWEQQAAQISHLFKIEMLAGLIALSVDVLISR